MRRRDRSPAGDAQGLALELRFQFRPGGVRERIVLVQEDQSGSEPGAEFELRVACQRTQEFLGPLQHQAAAVAGFAVGRDRAAVSEPIERGNSGLDQPMAWLVVQACDEPETTSVALERFAVQPAAVLLVHRSPVPRLAPEQAQR
jgi:hypothetical protein